MKKLMALLLSAIMVVSVSACSSGTQTASETDAQAQVSASAEVQAETSAAARSADTETQSAAASQAAEDESVPSSDILIVYFSRTGENYKVGTIEKGNTAIIAEMIAEQTKADMFEIVPETAYSDVYDEILEVAKKEKEQNARPSYEGDVENWDDYDTVFIGYPIWHSDMPMVVYTFLESHDWTGKTVIPFDTHGGSGLAGTESSIREKTGAKVLDGLAIAGTEAQNDQTAAKKDVTNWLTSLEGQY